MFLNFLGVCDVIAEICFLDAQFLVDSGLHESEEDSAKREVVLHRIKQVFAFFIFNSNVYFTRNILFCSLLSEDITCKFSATFYFCRIIYIRDMKSHSI